LHERRARRLDICQALVGLDGGPRSDRRLSPEALRRLGFMVGDVVRGPQGCGRARTSGSKRSEWSSAGVERLDCWQGESLGRHGLPARLAALLAHRMSLAELLSEAARGNQQAWDAIVERFSSLVWATARAHRLSRDDAADVAQTTWLRLV